MGKKPPPQQVVCVSVVSSLTEFVNHPIQRCLANINETWHDVLKKHKLNVDPDVYCLKSAKTGDVLLMHEKIGDYVAQYKRRVDNYKVNIRRIQKADKAKIGEKLRNHTKNIPKVQQSGSKKKRARPPAEIVKTKTSSPVTKKRSGNNITLAPEKRPRFAEDSMHVPPTLTDETGPSNFQFFDDDDALSMSSQESQDSQDPGYDIKSGIVDKMLKCMSNGDMQRVRKELLALKEKQTFMKVARYIPYTFSMLQSIFAEQ